MICHLRPGVKQAQPYKAACIAGFCHHPGPPPGGCVGNRMPAFSPVAPSPERHVLGLQLATHRCVPDKQVFSHATRGAETSYDFHTAVTPHRTKSAVVRSRSGFSKRRVQAWACAAQPSSSIAILAPNVKPNRRDIQRGTGQCAAPPLRPTEATRQHRRPCRTPGPLLVYCIFALAARVRRFAAPFLSRFAADVSVERIRCWG
jgi:hypothetical protein